MDYDGCIVSYWLSFCFLLNLSENVAGLQQNELMWTEWHYNTIEGKCNLRGLWGGLYTFYQYTFNIFFVLFFCGMWFIIIPVLIILPTPIHYSIGALFNLIFYKFIKNLVAQNWVLKIWNDEKLILLIVIANKEGKKPEMKLLVFGVNVQVHVWLWEMKREWINLICKWHCHSQMEWHLFKDI